MVTAIIIEVDKRHTVWLYERFDNGVCERVVAGPWFKVFWGYDFRPSVPVHVRRAGWRARLSRFGDAVWNAVYTLGFR